MIDSPGLSSSLEDYLEAIYHIVEEKSAAKANDIAKRLGVRNSSVTGALRALAGRSLVNYAPYDLVTLTDEGRELARGVVRRHQVLFEFLVRVLSVPQDEAEETACGIEHLISKSVLDRLVGFIEFVERCPNGGAQWVDGTGYRCPAVGERQDCDPCIEHRSAAWDGTEGVLEE